MSRLNVNQIYTRTGTGSPAIREMPTFSVHTSASQSFSPSTWTVIQFNLEDWDTDNNFDTTTYRFTPIIAGYYQVNVNVGLQFTGTSSITGVGIYKNGAIYLVNVPYASFNSGSILTVSGLVYLNGTTDYITGNVYSNATNPFVAAAIQETRFSAALVRTA